MADQGHESMPGAPMPPGQQPRTSQDKAGLIIGVVLIFVGGWLLLRTTGVIPAVVLEWIGRARGLGWPLALIVGGIAVIVWGARPHTSGPHMPAKGTRLYRSRKEKVIAGVFGGLGDYFHVDPTFLRLVFVALALAFGGESAIVAYIIAAIIIPQEPKDVASNRG